MNKASEQALEVETNSTNYGWYVMGFLWGLNLMVPLAVVSLGVMCCLP